jgi:AraC-like DNA-binding protein
MLIRRLAFESALVAILDERGIDHRPVTAAADFRKLDRHGRFYRLAGLALRKTRDPLLGVTLGRRVPLANFGLLGQAILNARSLRHAFQIALRYMPIFQASPRRAAQLTVAKEGVYLEYLEPVELPESRTFMTDLWLSAMLQQMRQITDPALKGIQAEIRHMPPEPDAYRAAIGVPVVVRGKHDRLGGPLSVVNAPLPAFFVPRSDIHLRMAEVTLDELAEERDITGRVAEVLAGRSGLAASATDVARALNMSERSLRRRLQAAGTSFGRLAAKTRLSLAQSYLKILPVAEVAALLGYHDASTFRRAYQRWRGETPGEQHGRARKAASP